MKIVGITTKLGAVYNIDNGVGGNVVEKIVYFKEVPGLYNKGYQLNESSYVVYMNDSAIRTLVPQREISEVRVDTTKEKKKDNETSAAAEETPDDFLGTEENTEDLAEGA